MVCTLGTGWTEEELHEAIERSKEELKMSLYFKVFRNYEEGTIAIFSLFIGLLCYLVVTVLNLLVYLARASHCIYYFKNT